MYTYNEICCNYNCSIVYYSSYYITIIIGKFKKLLTPIKSQLIIISFMVVLKYIIIIRIIET